MDLHQLLRPQDVPALSAGVESILRRLIRLILGSISLTRLEEMLRLVFVEEAEKHLAKEYAGRSTPNSQLALLTGLDTRQLNKVRQHENYRSEGDRSAGFTSTQTPTTHLLDLWSTNPELMDSDSGQPKPLNILGPDPSVESLMKQSRFMRGVTPRSVADRLVLSGAATEGDDGQLHMVTDRFLPDSSRDMEGAIEVGFHAMGRLMDTVTANLEGLGSGKPRLVQRAYWTNRLAPHRRAEFRERLQQLMAGFEDQGTTLLTDMEMKIESPSQITCGFGFYSFEDPIHDPD